MLPKTAEAMDDMSGFRFPSAEAIMAEVQAATGLDDYGEGNPAVNLARFLEAVQREARLHEATAVALLEQVRVRLANRLQIEQWYHTHLELELADPPHIVSITGLPRTGTSALVNLLSLDEQFRPLRAWEQSESCPPPKLSEEQNDPRRLQALAKQEAVLRARPELKALHLFDVDATEEDFELLGASFQAQQYTLPIYGYHAWWREADLRTTFRYHKRILRLLASRRPPNRWLLKAPAHCFHLDALFDAYPDARVIMTHRDPAKTVPSTASLLSAFYPAESKPDPNVIGAEITEHLRTGMERAMAARREIGEDKFFDVHHRDLVSEPVAVLERLYEFLGMELTSAMRARVDTWLAGNRPAAHGVHRYTPEQFGLTAASLRSTFDPYMRCFGVEAEG